MKRTIFFGKVILSIAFSSFFLSCGTDPAVWVGLINGVAGGIRDGLAPGTGGSGGSGYQPSPGTNQPTTRTRPGTPTGVTAARNPASSMTVQISWSAVSGATSYRVYHSFTGSGTGTIVGRPTTTSYNSVGNSLTSTHYFRVSAYSSAGGWEGEPSSWVIVGSAIGTGSSTTTSTATNTRGTQVNPIPLTVNTYADGSITSSTAGGALWFSFSATSGTTYNVYLDDYDVTSGRLDAQIDAAYQGGTSIFNGVDRANPQPFTANRTGTVLLRVYPLYGSTGSIRVMYSSATRQSGSSQTTTSTTPSVTNTSGTQASPIPLTLNDYANGSITSSTSGRALWYSFSATNGTTYHVYLDDYDQNASRLDAVIEASYQGGAIIFTGVDIASPEPFTANRNGTVLLKVSPRSSGDTGSFRVAYARAPQQTGSSQTATNTSGTQSNPIQLTYNSFTNGYITSSAAGAALWYSFSVTSGTAYNVYLDDYDQDPSKLDAIINASYQGGASIFTDADIAYPQLFTANSSGIVLLKVSPRSSGSTGNFRIGYARAS